MRRSIILPALLFTAVLVLAFACSKQEPAGPASTNTGGSRFSLTVSVDPLQGAVAKVPDTTSFDSGSTVLLVPSAATGYSFVGWGGDTAGATRGHDTLTITMNANRSVTAVFVSILSSRESAEWTTLLVAGYSLPVSDTMEIRTTDATKCSDTTAVPIDIPADTQRTKISVSAQEFKIALTSGAMQSILGQMPGIDSATLAGLQAANSLLTGPVGAALGPIYAVFADSGANNGVMGTWVFSAIDLGGLRGVLLSPSVTGGAALVAQIDSMSGALAGKLILEFEPSVVRASVKRDWYVEEFVHGIADTSLYAILPVKMNDTSWIVTATGSLDTTMIKGLTNGNMQFTAANVSWTPQPYIYRLNPAPADCPNHSIPDWYGAWRDPRHR
jgi:uncharacterized repeat protein (TIGR02543 family)